MAYDIVCISRSVAAGGEEIGRAVARRLRYRYVDDEIVLKAADRARVSPAEIAAAEHSKPLVDRIVDVITSAMPVDPTGASVQRRMTDPPPPRAERLIEQVVCETADDRRVVIIAHAASMALAGKPGLLRVFVTASPETRMQRLMHATQLSEGGAKKAVASSDRERRDYLKRFYKVEEERPTHYDLVINTDVLDMQQAADLIVTAAQGVSSE